MALDFKSFFNKIRIKNATNSSKQLDLVVSDSSTANTTTTVVANQTANRTLTLPDSSGTVVATSVTLDNLAAVTTDSSGQITTDSGISKSELQSLEGITGLVQTRLNSAESNISSIDGRVTTVEGNRALTTLSNLGTTSINQNLLPDTAHSKDLGNTSKRWNNLHLNIAWITDQVVLGGGTKYRIQKNGYTPSANLTNTVESYDVDLGLFTSNDPFGGASVATKNVRIETGNKTSGTGNSGDIKLQTGTSFGGTRGKIILDGSSIDVSAKVVKNAADPVSAQDLATKNYVDLNSGTGGGANKTLSNLEPTSINQPLIPQVDSSLALGSSNFRWASVSCTSVNSTNASTFNRATVGGSFDIQGVPFSAHGIVIGPDRVGVVKTQDNLSDTAVTKDLYITTGDNAVTGGGSGSVFVRAGAATYSGGVYIESSSSSTGATGGVTLRTGNSTGAAAGSINIYAGDGASSGGGQVIISAGKNGPTQRGGKISLIDGNNSSISSGHIILEAGKGSNISGSIYLTPGTNGSGAKGTIFVGGPLGLDAQPSDPLANLQIGQIYFNTTSNTIKVYTSTGWKTLTPT